MDLLQMIVNNELLETRETKKFEIPGATDNIYKIYEIPLDHLYYNDQNGRINTSYKKYKAKHGQLEPEKGNSKYNSIFESFIYESNSKSLDKTLESIDLKGQLESGVVLPDGRILDGNRRFTALRKLQEKYGLPKTFKAVVLELDPNSKLDEKIIKTIELDLQLGREERVNYNPIDSIFDVYNTIVVEKIMNEIEYRNASGAGNTQGIKKDIRIAELILRFIEIISPGGNPIDKFYLARDLDLDGPMKEVENTLNKLVSSDKEAIKDSVLVYMAIAKTDMVIKEPKLALRDLRNHVLSNPEILEYYVDAVEDKVDDIIDGFEIEPIESSNDLNAVLANNENLNEAANKMVKSTERLIYKGSIDSKRTRVLVELENVRDNFSDIDPKDFEELTVDETITAKEVLSEINDIYYKIKREI